MDYFQGLRTQIRAYLIFVILLENILVIGGIWFATTHFNLSLGYVAFGAYAVSIIMTFIITFAAADYSMQPLEAVWQAIVHIAPNEHQVAAPNINKLVVGRVLVSNLTAQIYQIASIAEHVASEPVKDSSILQANFVANNLPLPLFVLNSDQTILFANDAACKYIGRPTEEVIDQNVYSVLPMSFPSEQTLDSWLDHAKVATATATTTWERVRLDTPEGQPSRLFDLAAYYNKDNAQKYETLLVLFDHTEQYSQDDQAVSYIALAVHELRTPLTLLRGYIEVFEDELDDQLTPELRDFMHKMNASAQQLTAFVNNILNVARIEQDQLALSIHKEEWAPILRQAVEMVQLRAKVRGITLEFSVADDLPMVGVDRLSIQEVIDNLIDNAIKYSGASAKIKISASLNREGMVETTVQDWGSGIPTAVMPHLFNKFYRDHHKRAQIGGSGLGLYLSKAIIAAHGGQIWVRSREGQGAIFGFTLTPYEQLAEKQKNGDNTDIVRGAHGWIKNHSLYRR